jgi:hypothetical protein
VLVHNDDCVVFDFVTDLEIGNNSRGSNGFVHDDDDDDDGALIEWLPDENEMIDAAAHSSAGGDGWSVEAMFLANRSLGVVSTFEDDLSQYTT